MEGNQLVLFMFLIVILCILCIMLGYFYAKTKIRYFFNKMREEEIKIMQQQRQKPNVRVHRSSDCGRRKRKIVKIDIESGKILEKYNSIAEASRLNKLNKSNINSVCKGLRKFCGGYIWKYCEEKEVM